MSSTFFSTPIGPGSQPADDDGASLAYMEMPSGMMTYRAPLLPEPEEVAGIGGGLAVLDKVLALLERHERDGAANVVDLRHLDAESLKFVDQALGEGEVAVIGGATVQAQESVLAGVWRVRTAAADGVLASDVIEVAAFPSTVTSIVFAGARDRVELPETFGPGVFNAPPLFPEINDRIAGSDEARDPHVINLSLLPHTEQDLALLAQQLGQGWLKVLSRGYGNCRVSSTMTRNVWWVQFYNSQDALILNTIEITPIPEVVRAAPEDMSDSAARLREILEVYR